MKVTQLLGVLLLLVGVAGVAGHALGAAAPGAVVVGVVVGAVVYAIGRIGAWLMEKG